MTIPLIVFAAAVVMITVELLHPARKWPKVAAWWLRAIAFNAVQVGVAYLAAYGWDGWMQAHQPPWAGPVQTHLGVTAQAAVGYVVITFIYYWWHRWRHESTFLWRVFHQFHHSPQRIEVVTSFYKHPLEILANGILSSTILYFLVGVTPQAAAYAVLLTGLAELFYHWNVSTPYWLGFVIQRPESHCIHHMQGHHRQNFADLPLWDMLFGTFHNPRKWEARCGFGEDEHRLGEMLRCVDLTPRKPQKPG
ncbi:MAG: sterol desaturase family protein [Planctomycetaceae bacterium]